MLLKVVYFRREAAARSGLVGLGLVLDVYQRDDILTSHLTAAPAGRRLVA